MLLIISLAFTITVTSNIIQSISLPYTLSLYS
nr:MAG TPA: hypothetical protein [Caudoviricetes sp.]